MVPTSGKIGGEKKYALKVDYHKIATGPGSYEGVTPSNTNVKVQSPNYGFSKSKRNDLILAQVITSPGPGTYGLYNKHKIGYMET